jgi:hypothetical protein
MHKKPYNFDKYSPKWAIRNLKPQSKIDNSTAERVINNKSQPKITKAMDMRFHWLQDCEAQ